MSFSRARFMKPDLDWEPVVGEKARYVGTRSGNDPSRLFALLAVLTMLLLALVIRLTWPESELRGRREALGSPQAWKPDRGGKAYEEGRLVLLR
jgi:hypothetical protein